MSGYLVLLSGIGGVTLTVIAGFIGAWVQGRREHRTWRRERRFDAYVSFLRFMSEVDFFDIGGIPKPDPRFHLPARLRIDGQRYLVEA